MSIEQLKQQWKKMLSKQPRVKVIKREGNHFRYVQRSKIFRFPDIIDIEFLEIDTKHSSLNAFSRSVYGYSDLGVNQKRMQQWLVQLLHS